MILACLASLWFMFKHSQNVVGNGSCIFQFLKLACFASVSELTLFLRDILLILLCLCITHCCSPLLTLFVQIFSLGCIFFFILFFRVFCLFLFFLLLSCWSCLWFSFCFGLCFALGLCLWFSWCLLFFLLIFCLFWLFFFVLCLALFLCTLLVERGTGSPESGPSCCHRHCNHTGVCQFKQRKTLMNQLLVASKDCC